MKLNSLITIAVLMITLVACTANREKLDLSDDAVALMEGDFYHPSDSILKLVDAETKAESAPVKLLTKTEKIGAGHSIYTMRCMSCHQQNGEGLKGTFPPLAKSDYFASDINKAIFCVKKGMSGKITVNGNEYNNVMPQLGLTDEEIANVLTYVANNWGNGGVELDAQRVASVN